MDSQTYHGRCLARRCGFKAEGQTQAGVETELRDHVKAKHRRGAEIEIDVPIMTWTPEGGWRDAG